MTVAIAHDITTAFVAFLVAYVLIRFGLTRYKKHKRSSGVASIHQLFENQVRTDRVSVEDTTSEELKLDAARTRARET